MFTGRDKTEIPKALLFLSEGIRIAGAHLTILDMSDNAFGPRGLVGLQELLESSVCYSLQELHLNNNGLGISGAQLLSDSMCKCIENSKKHGTPLQLKIFVCGRNRLENQGAALVAKFLKLIGTLESIAMPQNGIYPPGIEALSEAFTLNPKLKVINLEDNSLTVPGAKLIAKCLPYLADLQILNLGDCLIRTDGAMALATAFESSCPEIMVVNLGFNEISFNGGEAVIEALAVKDSLQSLNLNGNCFGDEGCMVLTSTMEKYGNGDVLESLEEDEGENDDDEEDEEHFDEDDDDENYEDEEEEGDYQDDGDKFNQDDDSKSKPSHQSIMLKVCPADFISNPSPATLIALHKSKQDFASVLPSEPSIKDYTDLFFKISSVVSLEDESAKSAAIEYADAILPKAYALSSDAATEFNNEFLVSVGLIKGEDEKKKKNVDATGTFLVLAHVVKQPYCHGSTRDLLQIFLSRPLQYITIAHKVKQIIMQALFQM